MDEEAVSLYIKVELVQCKRHDTKYLTMSHVCNLFTICLEDVEASQVGIY
jgi:hypothetical protein